MRFLGWIAACVAAGCGTAAAPDDALVAQKKPSARLHLEQVARGSAPSVKVSLVQRPIEHCQASLSGPVTLATLGDAFGRASREVRIPAEAPITLLIASATASAKCEFRARFTPEAGAEYRLTYLTVRDGCLLTLDRRDAGAGRAERWSSQPYADPNPECDAKPSGAK